MSRRPTPLPEAVRGRAFLRREVPELSGGRLCRADLWRPAHGVRLPAGRTEPIDVLRARELLLPAGAANSHTTAAFVLGMPLPIANDGVAEIHVTTPSGTRARRGRGVVGHQRRLAPDEVATVDGVTVTRIFRTLCDLPDVVDFPEMVAIGDWIIGRSRTGITVEQMRERLATAPVTASRRAFLLDVLARVDGRSESAKESELRVLLEDAGLGPFALQMEIFDSQGRFVARPDILLPELKIAIEYEGDHHRSDKKQWRRDQARRRRLEALGWKYIVVTQSDLADPAALLDDLRAAIRERS